MRIRSLHVKNFRSIKDAELSLGALTAFVGKNGSGKSNLLNVLDFFYHPPSRLSEADFFAEDVSQPIEISITYDSLSAAEKTHFSKHCEGDILTVTGVFSFDSSDKAVAYYGTTLQNPDFAEIRNTPGKGNQRSLYRELRNRSAYSSLPTASSADAALQAMEDWERDHPEECQRLRDSGQFFGWTGVAQGYLRQYTQLILIPAVRDAGDDATERRGSAITELVNLFIRDSLDSSASLTAFKENTRAEFSRIMDEEGLPRLRVLQHSLTDTLKFYVPDASLLLDRAEPEELTIPTPQAAVRVEEDGFATAVARSGHGLQRALVLTLLQQLETAQRVDREASGSEDQLGEAESLSTEPKVTPNLILAIEEPELYQHPSRQRHFASVLANLASGSRSGETSNIQVVYTTHSPLFVGLERSDEIRVVRKTREDQQQPKDTRIRHTTLDSVASQLAEIAGRPGEFTAVSLRPRLQAVMTPVVNEGFFADVVVLVEGDTDRSAILGTAGSMGHDFDAEGIAVVPCGGKQELDRPFVIFRNLGIPTYVVWDGDRDSDSDGFKRNRYILRMIGKQEEDWPQFVDDASACFAETLECTLEEEIGKEIYERVRQDVRDQFGLGSGQSPKNPLVIRRTVELAAERGAMSETVREIVNRVVQLKKGTQP